jgi:hypothetical protein
MRPGCYTKESIDKLMAEIKKQGSIESIEPNALRSVTSEKNLKIKFPFFQRTVLDSKQWDMSTPPGGVNASTAWTNHTTGSRNATIAVLDTGILDNASLNPNVLPGVYFNNDGDFGVGATPSCDVASCTYYHGTHVAGTIAASGLLAYSANIYGVAPTSTVLPINVFTKFTNPTDCNGPSFTPCLLSYTSDEINALNWLAGTAFTDVPPAPQTVAGINMSLGGYGSCGSDEQDAFNAVSAIGLTSVIAAGNSNANAANYAPANCAGVVTVAATGPSGERAGYSNWGSTVAIAAPGGNDANTTAPYNFIYSTVEDAYASLQGTSMAAPHVAGLVALLYSLDPTLNATTATALLTNLSAVTAFPTSVPAGTTSCIDNSNPTHTCGAGIIEANLAGNLAAASAPALLFSAAPSIASITSNSASVTWSAAQWNPSRTTAFLYTVYLNGSSVGSCSNIGTLTCALSGLSPSTSYTLQVRSTDFRQIHTPVETASASFTTLGPPVLSNVARSPLDNTTAYIYFSSLGGNTSDLYTLIGGPSGAQLTVDTAHSRFMVTHFNVANAATVQIQVTINGVPLNSNSVVIPNIL